MPPKPPEQIHIVFDPNTGRMQLAGIPMQTQEQKDHVTMLLLSAINLVVGIKLSVIQPAIAIPAGAGNGVTH